MALQWQSLIEGEFGTEYKFLIVLTYESDFGRFLHLDGVLFGGFLIMCLL